MSQRLLQLQELTAFIPGRSRVFESSRAKYNSAMSKRVCPWWIGYLLASRLRRFLHDPQALLSPYLHEGMTVLEPGPGMGFFTMELAKLVGHSGRVIAVDVQPRMIAVLKKRLGKAGLVSRVDARVVSNESLGVADSSGTVDFVLAFAVAHETPSSRQFFSQAAQASKPGARLLLAEPAGHVKPDEFERELADAAEVGFVLRERPIVRRCLAALLQKS
jgi:SAM-dependent methyltransferase